MKRFAGLATVAVAALVAACTQATAEAPGPNTARNYQVGGFDRIDVSGPYNVNVRTGAAPSVQATGPQNLIDRMVIEVRGNRLLIHPREERGFRWNGGHRGNVEVSVTVPQLSGARIGGSGGIRVDQVRGPSFEGDIQGSGGLELASLDVQSLNLSVGGSGGMRAGRGRAKALALSISGSGAIDTRGVQAETAQANISGSGSISARATGSAAVSISGSGNVEITGGAKCTTSTSGSGHFSCS
jgi:hypothetical protein